LLHDQIQDKRFFEKFGGVRNSQEIAQILKKKKPLKIQNPWKETTGTIQISNSTIQKKSYGKSFQFPWKILTKNWKERISRSKSR
jgi:hypothetical protein